MSLPAFPTIDPPLTEEESLNMILTSIAMEELGLSHIINAEGEKLQYVLGTLENGGSCKKPSVDEVLAVNKSIKGLLDSVAQNQIILKGKMECAVEALDRRKPGTPEPPCSGRCAGCGAPCRAVSFPGCPKQCWDSGKPLVWQHSECSKCCSLRLSKDSKRILLNACKCFAVGFSIDLRTKQDCGHAAIAVQTIDGFKKSDRFIYHTPVLHEGVPFTASASGIFVSTQACPAELMLTLLSPGLVEVSQSSICVMEI